jgi:hypothetical protein
MTYFLHGERPGTVVPQISMSVTLKDRLPELEDKIRQNLPGFEQFQSPPDVAQLMDLAEFGPSDGNQCHRFRIDAFIVTYHDIRAIPLPELKWDELNASMKMFYGTDSITDGDNEDPYERDADPWRKSTMLWNAAFRPVLQRSCIPIIKRGRRAAAHPCTQQGVIGAVRGRNTLPMWYLTCGQGHLHTRPSYGGTIAFYVTVSNIIWT